MGILADTYGIVCCDTAAAMCDYTPIERGLEDIDARLDILMRRQVKVFTTLAAITSDEWWWPNQCIHGGE